MRIGLICLDPVIGDAIASLLSRSGGFDVVFRIGHLLKLVDVVQSETPDLVIFTEEFDDRGSRKWVRQMRKAAPVRTMLLHAQKREDLGVDPEFDVAQSRWAGTGALFDTIRGLDTTGDASESGARAPAPKVRDEAIARRLAHLSLNERHTAHLVAQGMPNKDIAIKLNLSEPTIKLYVGRLLRDFECDNRVQLALKLQPGFTEPPDDPMTG